MVSAVCIGVRYVINLLKRGDILSSNALVRISVTRVVEGHACLVQQAGFGPRIRLLSVHAVAHQGGHYNARALTEFQLGL